MKSLVSPPELCLPSSCYCCSHYLVAEVHQILISSISASTSQQGSPNSPDYFRYLLGMRTLCTECPQRVEKAWRFLLLLPIHGQKMYAKYPDSELRPYFSYGWERLLWDFHHTKGSNRAFSGGSVVKNLPASAGDLCLIPGLGRWPGEGNGNPLPYSCLGNPMDRGVYCAIVQGVAKELDVTEQLNNNNSKG